MVITPKPLIVKRIRIIIKPVIKHVFNYIIPIRVIWLYFAPIMRIGACFDKFNLIGEVY